MWLASLRGIADCNSSPNASSSNSKRTQATGIRLKHLVYYGTDPPSSRKYASCSSLTMSRTRKWSSNRSKSTRSVGVARTTKNGLCPCLRRWTSITFAALKPRATRSTDDRTSACSSAESCSIIVRATGAHSMLGVRVSVVMSMAPYIAPLAQHSQPSRAAVPASPWRPQRSHMSTLCLGGPVILRARRAINESGCPQERRNRIAISLGTTRRPETILSE